MKTKLFVCMVLAIFVGYTGTALGAADKGGQWTFDEGILLTAYDTLGDQNNGTLNGAPTWVDSGGPGEVDGGYISFDGNDDYVSASDVSDEFDITDNLTLEAYIRITGGSGGRFVIFRNNAYYLGVNTSNQVEFRVYISGTPITINGSTPLSGPGWYHIAGTYRSSIGMQVWLNRSVDGSNSQAGLIDTNDSDVGIGGTANGGYLFTGDIDYPQVLNDFDTSLPVVLSSFTAIHDDNGVTLKWRTESEWGNVGFNVYRSEKQDGKFVKVNDALVPGAGSTEIPREYQFIDEEAEAGKTYFYYLEDVDIEGVKDKSHVIKVGASFEKSAQPIISKKFRLLQNFPNPFNPETWMPYELATNAVVTINIYNARGQLVHQLELNKQKAGSYIDKTKAAYWDGKDRFGRTVSSGLYFYIMKAGDFQAVRRMVILK